MLFELLPSIFEELSALAKMAVPHHWRWESLMNLYSIDSDEIDYDDYDEFV